MSIRTADEVFDFMRYPAGEPHVTIAEWIQKMMREGPENFVGHTTGIIWEAFNYDDLVLMVVAWKTLARRFGQEKKFIVPYFPFGRHDCRRDEWDSDPLHMALDIVRPMMDANCLITIDPHSNVSGVIPHVTQREIVRAWGAHNEASSMDTILIPDAGATKRAEIWVDLFPHCQVLQAYKHRDVRTGELSGFHIDASDTEIDEINKVLIVDDICDGGGTFLGLAAELPAWAETPTLLTTHGLYTKGTTELAKVFDLWTLDLYGGKLNTKMLLQHAFQTGKIR